jgi:hypothetical protein
VPGCSAAGAALCPGDIQLKKGNATQYLLRCSLKFIKIFKDEGILMQIRESFPQVILSKAGKQPVGYTEK